MRAEFRCAPTQGGVTQQCTYCGDVGHWASSPYVPPFMAPTGHSVRDDGTLGCPRSTGDRYADADRLEWDDGATRAWKDGERL